METHSTNLRRVGGSVMLAVPPAMLTALRLRPGARVGIVVRKGRLVVAPRKRPRYTLEELLSGCNRKAAPSKEDRAWIAGEAAGGELI